MKQHCVLGLHNLKVILTLVVCIFATLRATATVTVLSPLGNIVQNGTFAGYNFSYWSGLGAIVGAPNAPNGIFALGGDIYQDIPTMVGQLYNLDFYAAADLYFGASLTLEVALNSQQLVSITTPSYAYNPQVNRYDQMRWAEYTYSFVGTTSITRLEFIDQNTYDFGLTAVSVTTVPEPNFTWFLLMVGLLATGKSVLVFGRIKL